VVTGSSVTVIEVDMNAGDESAVGFATVRASVAQASSIFYDTPATIGMCIFLSTHLFAYLLASAEQPN
jgi:hypothetical protein